MNVFLFELRSQTKSIIYWTIGLLAICGLFMMLYPSFSSDTSQMKDMLSAYPPELLRSININIDQMFSMSGFYPFAFTYVSFGGAVCALNFGLGVISKENRAKTTDFLLSKPLKRYNIITQKLLSILCSILIIDIIYIIGTVIMCKMAASTPFSLVGVVLISITLFFIQLVFAAIGVVVGTFFKRVKSVVPISLSISFGFFALEMIDAFINKNLMQYISPFKYFNYTEIVSKQGYRASSIMTVIVVTAMCIAVSYYWYIKQDAKNV